MSLQEIIAAAVTGDLEAVRKILAHWRRSHWSVLNPDKALYDWVCLNAVRSLYLASPETVGPQLTQEEARRLTTDY